MYTNKNLEKLDRNIRCIKYTLFCFNLTKWILGVALFGLTVWIRAESGYQDWLTMMHIQSYYIGIYILIVTSIAIMAFSFLGCISVFMGNSLTLYAFTISQILAFIFLVAGGAVLMAFSSMNTTIQPIIRDSMRQLIMSSEYPASITALRTIQESIGCCGADGANDYILYRQPLPYECRDTVTGNAFFHGCVDELTWFLEDKSSWVAGLGMTLAMINVINIVMSLTLVQALKKEENEAITYRG